MSTDRIETLDVFSNYIYLHQSATQSTIRLSHRYNLSHYMNDTLSEYHSVHVRGYP